MLGFAHLRMQQGQIRPLAQQVKNLTWTSEKVGHSLKYYPCSCLDLLLHLVGNLKVLFSFLFPAVMSSSFYSFNVS